LRPGGILLCYLPTVLQVKNLVDALREDRRFACMETSENLMRFWHFKGMSARPQHRMVAHTGFLTSAGASPTVERHPRALEDISRKHGNH
jgi:tRNA (adenine57-N1/adenine58-N1)-methyltransferase